MRNERLNSQEETTRPQHGNQYTGNFYVFIERKLISLQLVPSDSHQSIPQNVCACIGQPLTPLSLTLTMSLSSNVLYQFLRSSLLKNIHSPLSLRFASQSLCSAPINRFDSTPAHWHLYGHGSLCGPVSVRNALDMRKFPLEDRRISDDSVVPSNAS